MSLSLRLFPKPARAATGYFVWVVQARVEECSLPLQLEVTNEGIPVSDGAPAPAPCMQIDAGHPECGRNERGGWLPIGAKRFAIEVQLRVELSWSPTGEHLLDRRFIDPQKAGEHAQIRGERHDGTDV